MRKIALTITAFMLVSAGSTPSVLAQQMHGPMTQTEHGAGGALLDRESIRVGAQEPDIMMGGGTPSYGMMTGAGMMDHRMMRMMFVIIDTDGDGALSLAEFQSVHERMFNAMDVDKDGELTPEEMDNFMGGATNSKGDQ